eukprot:gene16169-22509_t
MTMDDDDGPLASVFICFQTVATRKSWQKRLDFLP